MTIIYIVSPSSRSDKNFASITAQHSTTFIANCSINHNFHVIFWEMMGISMDLMALYDERVDERCGQRDADFYYYGRNWALLFVCCIGKTIQNLSNKARGKRYWYANWVINILECHTIADLIIVAFVGRVSLTQKSKITFQFNSWQNECAHSFLIHTHTPIN